jgi:hypothetical protein
VGTVPSPGTATAGTPALASVANTWRDTGLWYTVNHPMFIGRSSANQSIASGGNVAITLDLEDIDSDAGHSLVTNTSRYTAQTAGYYFVAGWLNFAANATGYRQLDLKFNGATTVALQTAITIGAGAATHCSVATVLFLNGTTDYVEMQGFQNSGAGLNVAAGARMCCEWQRSA